MIHKHDVTFSMAMLIFIAIGYNVFAKGESVPSPGDDPGTGAGISDSSTLTRGGDELVSLLTGSSNYHIK
jgi:hypothetical protein